MTLLVQVHRRERMAAAALGRIIRLQLRPHRLRELGTMRFIFRGGVDFPCQVLHHFDAGLEVPDQPGKKLRWHMTVRTYRTYPELILEVHALRVLGIRNLHFVAGIGAEGQRTRVMDTGGESPRKSDADGECKKA